MGEILVGVIAGFTAIIALAFAVALWALVKSMKDEGR